MIGKGDTRPDPTQNGDMVSNGNAPGDQTKTTNGFRSASTDPGNSW